MKIFDLHCDTITKCYKQKSDLRKNSLHFSLDNVKKYDGYSQLFAVWIHDDLRGDDAVKYFDAVADYFELQLDKYKDLISLSSDNEPGKVKALLTVEGGSACGGTLDGLRHLYNRGVKVITLTWNSENEIAGGAFSEEGFTEFGKSFVREAEALGIILDVSHLNRKSFFEFLEISRKPFIASHSNADIVNNPYGRKRNLTDVQINAIKERGGLIGLNFYWKFIEDEIACGFDAVARQIRHFLSLDCEDTLALGSDFDGCEINPCLSGADKLEDLYNYLICQGFSQELVDKIFFKNAERFFNHYR